MGLGNSHRVQRGLLVCAAVAGSSVLGVSPADAVLVQTVGPQSFSVNSSTTATRTGGPGSASSSISDQTFFNGNLAQFNTNTGILTGARVILNSTRKGTGNLSASGNTSGSGDKQATGNGDSGDHNLIAPGFNHDLSGSNSDVSASCSVGNSSASCTASDNTGNQSSNANVSVSSGNLGLYAGAGTVNVKTTADLEAEAIINNTSGNDFSTATEAFNLQWSGNVSIEYDYLAHASPSFDDNTVVGAITLDFGNVLVGTGGGSISLPFDIYNLLTTANPNNQADLDLDSISIFDGLLNNFTHTLVTFKDLDPGDSNSYNAFFNTSAVGSWSDQLILNLSDQNITISGSCDDDDGKKKETCDPFPGIGIKNYIMTINLLGSVFNRDPAPEPVPEPGTLALFGFGGLAVFSATRSRRKRK